MLVSTTATRRHMRIMSMATVFALWSGGWSPAVARPNCSSALVCEDAFGSKITSGFPDLVVSCPFPPPQFRMFPKTNFSEVLTGTCDQANTFCSIHVRTNDVFVPDTFGACTIPPGGIFPSDCQLFTVYEAVPTFCGALPLQSPNFCKQCTGTGGTCTTNGGRKLCIRE
jgi:hypothetical protein